MAMMPQPASAWAFAVGLSNLTLRQYGSEITDEFARVCLRLFRDACNEVVTWHRTLGRRCFLEGR
jgi:hypothetical protein